MAETYQQWASLLSWASVLCTALLAGSTAGSTGQDGLQYYAHCRRDEGLGAWPLHRSNAESLALFGWRYGDCCGLLGGNLRRFGNDIPSASLRIAGASGPSEKKLGFIKCGLSMIQQHVSFWSTARMFGSHRHCQGMCIKLLRIFCLSCTQTRTQLQIRYDGCQWVIPWEAKPTQQTTF